MTAMTQEGAELFGAFVAAYPQYVRDRLAALGIPEPVGWDDAVAAGREWLATELEALLEQPMAEQRRSPLEILQEAMTFPTRTLEQAGSVPPVRDQAAVLALPGDVFDLAPASSQDLGERAWKAHLAWGVAKAKQAGARPVGADSPSSRPPVVAMVSTDVMDRTKVEPTIRAAGYRLEVWRNPAAIESGLAGRPPAVVLVDLTHRAADEAIRSASAAGARTIAYGPHVDDLAIDRAKVLGAAEALPRSQFFRSLPELLPVIV